MEKIINALAYITLGLTLFQIYFLINKLWKRKHEQSVTESISISALLISTFINIVMSLKNNYTNNYPGMVTAVFWILSNVLVILIASGFWVANKKGIGLITLIKQALHLEKNEASYLIKSVIGFANTDIIINILVRLAMIDDNLDEREKRFIQTFADAWHIHIPWEKVIEEIKSESQNTRYINLRNDILNYITALPNPEQVAQLSDIIQILVKIDDDYSESEQLIVAELTGILNNYLNKDKEQPLFYTVIVPQNTEQELSIIDMNPNIKKKEQVFGGFAYMDGPFYSEKYANIICDKYRVVNLFSVAVPHNKEDEIKDNNI